MNGFRASGERPAPQADERAQSAMQARLRPSRLAR